MPPSQHPRPPASPPASPWRFPDPREVPDDLVGVGADYAPGTILDAYRAGLFPMPSGRPGVPAWFSPQRRGVLWPGRMHVSRSLRRSARGFEIRVDTACAAVIDGCADPRRPGAWIDGEIREAYLTLHELGWVHSVEAWAGGELAGGVYGLAVGGLFAGESMFHHRRDASKVALLGLVDRLRLDGAEGRLVDVQWRTPHLASLGVEEVDRVDYLDRLLPRALAAPSARLVS